MTEPVLGIDISKLKFNVCLIKSDRKLRHKLFPNTVTGCEQLTAWLSTQDVERVPIGIGPITVDTCTNSLLVIFKRLETPDLSLTPPQAQAKAHATELIKSAGEPNLYLKIGRILSMVSRSNTPNVFDQ